ncbi:MAG TPA: DNA topoisomerase (ATP-hydrolyzing) subunit B [Candidatus Aphodocola excrementigallinarum]|uniref:DNA gyrase subunit B n=1 Tax=Candidatus Aphodocola excrementigallinarum TaxID=2840670 RepID=A0A9D1INR1_9FIRM|nr:DNA topoisomerase (ATP-hydrolyzing) subunit B [Candidatus Aphodocola excrementigallinarum]
MAEKTNEHYDASDIQVLEGLEAVRKRPGMYIGTTDVKGLHHLVWEIVDNAIDESLAGYCNNIEIIINKDNSVTVKDDGRGIPVDIHPKTKISTVETVYTVLHAGGKFGGGGYKVSGGLHGVGASVVNALSRWVEVTVYKNGNIYNIRFENGGHTTHPLEIVGKCEENRTGTWVTFKPDPDIFDTDIFDYETLKVRVRELAFLNKGLRITLRDDRDEEDTTGETFLYEGGISEYVKFINQNKTPIHDDIIHLEGMEDNVFFEVALQYNTGYSDNIYSFVNNINTHDGGTHEEGVRRALTRVINSYARKTNMLKEKDESLTGDDVKEGLTMIISCKHPNPQFEGQTKGRLGNSEVRKLADKVFSEGFEKFLLENPEDAKIIVNKALLASHARKAAKRAREITRKSDLTTTNFFGKLSDCKSKDPKVSEIFIVEGDSAGGSAKKGRDSMTQAILPLRGKILNVEKARLDKALGNEEIRSIITAFGTGIGDEFDLSKLRYDKIIIMTDADVDGAHIRVLLLTLFYRFFRPIVEEGHVYAAQPPLFRIMHGKTRKYVLDDKEKDDYLASLPENVRQRAEIARMKGLGEMDAEELNETTMDIEKRTLRKITVEDCVAADSMFNKLMGEEVEPRRKFIEENARYVKNLDI